DDDAGLTEPVFGLCARDVGILLAKVEEHQMIVGAAGDELLTPGDERFGESLGVVEDALLVGLEVGLEGFAECGGLGGDDVHEWATLQTGEDGGVDLLCPIRL